MEELKPKNTQTKNLKRSLEAKNNPIGLVYEKELQKTNQTKFSIEKLMKKKDDGLYISNGKVVIIHLELDSEKR